MGNLGGTELLIIVGVLVLLFGATRLPAVARSLGQSARVFKGEMKGMKADDETRTAERPAPSELPAAPPATTPPAPPAAQAAPRADNRPSQPDSTA